MKMLRSLLVPAAVLGSIFSSPLAQGQGALGTPKTQEIIYPDDEPNTPEQIDLGKSLFFDPRLSSEKNVSCSTCHNPYLGWADGLQFARGSKNLSQDRHSPHLNNLAWLVAVQWDGKFTLEEEAKGPLKNPKVMNLEPDKAAERIKSIPAYLRKFEKAYPESKLTGKNVVSALAAFMRTLQSQKTPFDAFIAGSKNALGPEAIKGLEIFKGKGNCTKCHDGPNFTDGSYHNIGINDSDVGRGKFETSPRFKGAFKTPGLRNVSLTAPYMHNGSIKTLEDVVRFYSRGGDRKENIDPLIKPLNFSEEEIRNLIAFLATLSEVPVFEWPSLPEE